MNSYETNVMIDNLINNGYFLSSEECADIFIINSCTVTNTADSKTMKVVRRARSKENSIVVVVGCFVQVHKSDLSFIDADILLGNKNKSKVSSYLDTYLKNRVRIEDVYNLENATFEKMCLNNYNRTRAFVKVQDGCNNFCSYCIIPYSRGGVRSKPKEDVLNEVESLIKNGHQEIVLTGIHTGNYGAEFSNYDFASLLSDLVKIEGLKRLRVSSIEITEINERVLDIIKKSDILVDHMHIPLQSGSDFILQGMNRKYDINYFIDKVACLRQIRPNISITTDVIVGFPLESEKIFRESVDNIKKIGFTKLHVFPYSKRSGTKASEMDGQVSEDVKKKRVRELLDLSKSLEISYMNGFVGSVVSFIPEVFKDGYLIGHTGNYLLIKCQGDMLIHDSINVKIISVCYPYCVACLEW